MEDINLTTPIIQTPKTNWLLFLVVGIVILGLGIGIGLFLGKQIYSSNTAQINSYDQCVAAKGSYVQESNPATCVAVTGQRFTQPIFQPSPAPTATIPGWKVIDGGKYKFRFEVPNDYSNNSSHLGDYKIIWPLSRNTFSDYASLSAVGENCCFQSSKLGGEVKVIVIEIWWNTTIDDWPNKALEQDNHPLDESQIIATPFHKTLKYSTREKVEGTFSDTSLISGFALENGSDVISFNMTHFPEDKREVKSLFDQILSTFRFVEQTSINTSNWKTYTNSQYNLEFKYPAAWQISSNTSAFQGGDIVSIGTQNCCGITISKPIKTSSSIEEYINLYIISASQQSGGIQYKNSVKNINNEDAIESKPVNCAGRCFVYTYLKHNGLLYGILSGTSDQTQYSDYADVFDQILSTFKFTN